MLINALPYNADFGTLAQAGCIASCKRDLLCLSTGFYITTDPSDDSQTSVCRYYVISVAESADLGPGYYNFDDKA